MTALRFSPFRVAAVAHHTFLAAVRQRVFGFLLVLAVALTGGSVLLREFNFGASELKFLTDFGLGALVFFGSILAVVVTAQMFVGEVEQRTALTLLAKPVLRAEFVVGKFLGAWLVTGVFCALVAGLLCAVLRVREAALAGGETGSDSGAVALVRYGDVAAATALQWVKFGVLGAITVFWACLATTQLLTVALSFLTLVICHLQYLAREAWQDAGTFAGRAAGGLVGLLFPNFQLFNVGELLAADQPLDGVLVARVAFYGLAYAAVFLALAAGVFRRKEL